MKEKLLYLNWACLYVMCVGFGTIVQRSIAGHIILMILSLIFFVPGIILVYDGLKNDNKKMLRRVRIISLTSLFLTLSMIILNILLVRASEAVGNALNDILIVVSAPMFCCYWRGIGPFLWACLFISSFPRMWKN